MLPAIRTLQFAVQPAPFGAGTLQRLRGEQERAAETRLCRLGGLEGFAGAVQLRLCPGNRQAALLRLGERRDQPRQLLAARLLELPAPGERLQAGAQRQRATSVYISST